jgi:hypothetical protein
MMTSRPAVPGLSIDDISSKIADLRAGLRRPDKDDHVKATDPVLRSKTFAARSLPDNISGRIVDLRQLGFANPVRMITSHPVILRYAIENICGKIVHLRELGNIHGKIADLRKLGFANPVKMFTPPNPAILGHAQERLLLCCGIVTELDKGTDEMLVPLIEGARSSLRSPLPSRGHGRRFAPSSPG